MSDDSQNESSVVIRLDHRKKRHSVQERTFPTNHSAAVIPFEPKTVRPRRASSESHFRKSQEQFRSDVFNYISEHWNSKVQGIFQQAQREEKDHFMTKEAGRRLSRLINDIGHSLMTRYFVDDRSVSFDPDALDWAREQIHLQFDAASRFALELDTVGSSVNGKNVKKIFEDAIVDLRDVTDNVAKILFTLYRHSTVALEDA